MSADQIETLVGPLVAREGGAPAGWQAQMVRFLEMLGERNRVVNLVSRASAHRVVEGQVVPSLAALLVVPPDAPLKVVDVGSGGGFPGIPLKIVRPRIRLDLVDATRKKCEFLEACLVEMGWNDDRVHWCRIEEPNPGLLARAPFERAFVRAVGADRRIYDGVARLLGSSGSAWAFRGTAEKPDESGSKDWPNVDGSSVTRLIRMKSAPDRLPTRRG